VNELTRAQELVLVECLRALEAGAGTENCLARFPEHESVLRPHLELRARLLAIEVPQPPAAAYAAGRQALLERLATPIPAADRSSRWAALRAFLGSGWPLRRVAAAGLLVLALAGGAVGASAAAGVDQAHDVLSALHIVAPAGQGDQQRNPNADEGASNQDDGIGNAPAASENGQQNADDRAADGGENADYGAGEEHRPCLPAGLLNRVPALQDLFAACPEDSALPGQTPPSSQGEPEAPTNSGLDHRPVTPPRPIDAGPQTQHEPGPPASVPTPHATDVGPRFDQQQVDPPASVPPPQSD